MTKELPVTIPAYDELMLPLLQLLNDGRERAFSDCVGVLAEQFKVSEEEQLQLLPSGRYPVFRSRVSWASTYLSKALLLVKPRRGFMVITKRGKDLLAKGPSKIDSKVLSNYSEWRAFQKGASATEATARIEQETHLSVQTPEELIEIGYRQFETSLGDEILERLKAVSPSFFERLVVQLLVAMGYGGSFEDAASVVGRSGDEGIDGIIKEDRLGLDAIYVQAKRWQGSVGRPIVAEFVGNLSPVQSSKGVLITTSTFTEDAKRWIGQVGRRIVLVDGQQLAELMIEYGVGVTPLKAYTLKRIDNDYFDEES